ncbi:MAG: cell division protein FtsQ/DivIB, partial [Longimicrobiales bacterium]
MRTALRRTALVLACAAAIVITAAFAPIALRGIHGFRVQRVEVNGVHYLTAQVAVEAAGITSTSNVFDDFAPWIDGLSMHPLVTAVRVQRRLPATIVLHIEEAVPIAFARTPELRAIGANGRILPTDLADDEMDLPVLTVRTRVSGDGRAVDPETLAIVEFLAAVGQIEPELIDWISEIDMHGDAVRLRLRSAADAEVLVPVRPTVERLRELSSTLAELATPQL